MGLKRSIEWHQKEYCSIENAHSISLESLPKKVIDIFIDRTAHPDDPQMLQMYPIYSYDWQFLCEYLDDSITSIEGHRRFISVENNDPSRRVLNFSNQEWDERSDVKEDEWSIPANTKTPLGSETLNNVPDEVMQKLLRLVADEEDPEMKKTYKFNIIYERLLSNINPYVQHQIRDDVFDYWISCDDR